MPEKKPGIKDLAPAIIEGTAKSCSSGFHFCENPLDVFKYYSPGESVYHEVMGGGQIDRHDVFPAGAGMNRRRSYNDKALL